MAVVIIRGAKQEVRWCKSNKVCARRRTELVVGVNKHRTLMLLT